MRDFTKYVRQRLGPLGLEADREKEIAEEIAEHMFASYEEARERGLSESNAVAFAESPFLPWEDLRSDIQHAQNMPNGGAASIGRGGRKHRGRFAVGFGTALASLWQDVCYGIRTLQKRPMFALISIGTLGLGIGTTTTMFSVVDGVLLRELPFHRPAELVTVWKAWPGSEWTGGLFWREYVEFRQSGSVFQEVAVHRPEGLILTGSGEPARLVAGVVSASLFPMLGVRPILGRLFLEGEDGPDALPLVVLSGELWRSRFGSDSTIIGQTILLDEVPYEVIGVVPAGFRLRNRPGSGLVYESDARVDTGERDVWLPVGFNGDDLEPWSMNLEFLGRVRAGVGLDQALAEADALLRRGQEQSRGEVRLAPLKEDDTAGVRFPLLLLLGASGILSLVACANVANLLVGEAIGRHYEMKTRAALGAGRLRIIRQLLTESLLLGLCGGLLGLVLAIFGVHLAVTAGPYLRGLEGVRVDYRVLLFAISLGVLTGITFGLAPALKSARLSPNLSEHRADWYGGLRFQRRVIALMFASTAVLVVIGGLLTRTFSNLIQLDTGFVADNVATIRMPFLPDRYDDLEARDAFFARVITEAEALPGVIQVSGADNLPFPGHPSGHRVSTVSGDDSLQTPLRRVLADYHEVMGIPLLAGRAFREADVEGNTPVVIVSQAVVDHFWPGRSAIGATLNHMAYGNLEVVGVVGEVLEGWAGTEARPMVYLPLAQTRQHEISLIARTEGDPVPLLPLLREAVWSVDPDVAVTMETTLESLVAESSLSERYRTLLVLFFAVSATLLAAVGIFGVTARSVALRTRELGIRVALGATGEGLVRMILRGSLSTALAGTVVGLIGAVWVSRLIAGFLFEVEPFDPATYGLVVLLLTGVCLVAAYLPTKQISTVDPVDVLRAE